MDHDAIQENLRNRFYTVLLYIQNHLDEPLSLEKLSELAALSPFHFHRQFKAFSGESLHDHIKRLRLEKAAYLIRHSDSSIINVSCICGYETASSFSKAFKSRFGESPRAFRNKNIEIHEEHGTYQSAPIIKMIDDHYVLFCRENGSYEQAAKKAWANVMRQAYSMGLVSDESQAIGITYDSPTITKQQYIRYDACITIDKAHYKMKGITTQLIEGGRFAIFHHVGEYHKIDALYDYIYGEWLLSSGERLRDQPVFCHYHNLHSSDVPEHELVTDIYLPLL